MGLSGQAHPHRMMGSAACRWGLMFSLPSTGNKLFDIHSRYSDTFQSLKDLADEPQRLTSDERHTARRDMGCGQFALIEYQNVRLSEETEV